MRETLKFRLILLGWRTVADLIYLVFVKIWPYRQSVILKNLTDCFPERDEKEIGQIAAAYFKHLADLIVEPFLISHIKTKHLDQLISYDNLGLIQYLLAEKKDIVLMASHCGNWEYLLTLPMFTQCNVLAAYSPVSNQFVNQKIRTMRSRYGVQIIPKADWYRTVVNWQKPDPSIFIAITDQRPAVPGKYFIDFMGQKTFIQAGAARIASNRNCAVVYLDVHKLARNRYQFRFELITEQAKRENEDQMMKRYFEALETTIRRKPELWLWSHNRWKFREPVKKPVLSKI